MKQTSLVSSVFAIPVLISCGQPYSGNLTQIAIPNPLHEACRNGNIQAVYEALVSGHSVNERDNHWNTPLHMAIRNGYEDIMEYLISTGADVYAVNEFNKTALHFACERNNKNSVNIVRKLVEKYRINVNARDNGRRTPLHVAVFHHSSDVVKYLVDHGADVNAKDSNNWTPMNWACTYHDFDIMNYLNKAGKSRK